jgi:hypothetical protein
VLTPCAALGIYQMILINGQAVGEPADDIRLAHSECRFKHHLRSEFRRSRRSFCACLSSDEVL